MAPIAALLLQRCSSVQSFATDDTRVPSSFLPLHSDHPLAQLRFVNQGLVSSTMHIEAVDTDILFSEGLEAWHTKGTHPYAYVTPFPSGGNPLTLDVGALPAPPVGIRSAPSLGGLGTGTLELRADGRLANWQVFNNSPGDGQPKLHVDDAFFGIRTHQGAGAARALTIRTQPPEGLPAISAIAGSGGFPVTRLRLGDPALPLAVELYAYGAFDPHSLAASALPAVVFTFVLSNPTPEAIQTSLMCAMPNMIEGTFRTEHGLVLSRSGSAAMSGELCMAFSKGAPAYSMVAPSLEEVWGIFAKTGSFRQQTALGIFEYGAISTDFLIEAGTSRAVSFFLSWSFPNRTIAGEAVGNQYTRRFTSTRVVTERAQDTLPDLWQCMQDWQALCLSNSLPSSVQDALLNSLSQLYKTTFCTADGRWRHWDSFANPGISTLDQQLYRAFPLLFFFPEVLKDQLRTYATHQLPGGQLVGSLGMGERYPLDAAHEPVCYTKTPIFFILAYLYYCHTADRAFLQDLWAHISKAVAWQLSITTPQGLPSNLPRLGDWQALDAEGFDLRDALLHICGLNAVMHIARALDVFESVAHVQKVARTGLQSIELLFWDESQYRQNTSTIPSGSHHEALPGFLFPLLNGMDELISKERLAQHLATIADQDASLLSLGASSKRNLSDTVVQPASTMQWAALHMLVNQSASTGLSTLSGFLDTLSDKKRDLWGYYEQLKPDGTPWANPNHTSHLSIWFVVLALSGQHYEAPSRRLRFAPLLTRNSRLPFFTPQAHGIIAAKNSESYVIEVVSGRLILDELQINDTIRHRDVFLEAGQSLTLTA